MWSTDAQCLTASAAMIRDRYIWNHKPEVHCELQPLQYVDMDLGPQGVLHTEGPPRRQRINRGASRAGTNLPTALQRMTSGMSVCTTAATHSMSWDGVQPMHVPLTSGNIFACTAAQDRHHAWFHFLHSR